VHPRPLRGRSKNDYLSRSRASQNQDAGSERQTAPKRSATVLNFLSGCANIVRASTGGICHYSDMASPKPNLSVAGDPLVATSPSE